jgi:hypothetical protein
MTGKYADYIGPVTLPGFGPDGKLTTGQSLDLYLLPGFTPRCSNSSFLSVTCPFAVTVNVVMTLSKV